MKTFARGFSLVELMVVIGIIGILSSIVYANLGSANPKARDAERQTDLRNLQTAIEQFKLKNGRYPEMGCPPPLVREYGMASEKICPVYIVGLVPEFITVLPKDNRRGGNLGYAYVTNDVGTTYKVMAVGTVESETVTATHKMKSCDTTDICNNNCGIGAGGFQDKSYALWGGYAANSVNDTAAEVKAETAEVICQ